MLLKEARKQRQMRDEMVIARKSMERAVPLSLRRELVHDQAGSLFLFPFRSNKVVRSSFFRGFMMGDFNASKRRLLV